MANFKSLTENIIKTAITALLIGAFAQESYAQGPKGSQTKWEDVVERLAPKLPKGKKNICRWLLVRAGENFRDGATLAPANAQVKARLLDEIQKAKQSTAADLIGAASKYTSTYSMKDLSLLMKETRQIRLNMLRIYLPYLSTIDDLEDFMQQTDTFFVEAAQKMKPVQGFGYIFSLGRIHIGLESRMHEFFMRNYLGVQFYEKPEPENAVQTSQNNGISVRNLVTNSRLMVRNLLAEPHFFEVDVKDKLNEDQKLFVLMIKGILDRDHADMRLTASVRETINVDMENYDGSEVVKRAARIEKVFLGYVKAVESRWGTEVYLARLKTIFYERMMKPEPLTLIEVAAQFDRSVERIRQVEQKLIRILKWRLSHRTENFPAGATDSADAGDDL